MRLSFPAVLLFFGLATVSRNQDSLVPPAVPELAISVGHSTEPTQAAFFGDRVVTAAWSNVAIIDLPSGLTVRHLPQGSLVQAIEASPAGDIMAVGTCDHAIQLWNTNSWTTEHRLALPQECAESISFSPDGAFLATGAYGCRSADNGLQIWDVHSGKLARELLRGSGIRNVVFSRDGRWVGGVDDKGKAKVFAWPSGQELRTFEGLEMAGYSDSALISSPDGRYLAWNGNGLRVWDVAAGRELASPAPIEQRVIARVAEFLNDGRLAYADEERLIVVHLPGGPQQVVSLPRAKQTFFGDVGISEHQAWLKIRRDGLLLVGSRGSRTVVWDSQAKRIRELKSPELVSSRSLQWSSLGIVAWANLESGVRGWDDRTGRAVGLAKGVAGTTGLAFRPDGARVAVVGFPGVSVIDVASRSSLATERVAATETAVAFSPDGLQLAFASSSNALTLFDGNLWPQRIIASLGTNNSVEHIAFSPDSRWIAAGLGGPHPALRVWSASESKSPITLDTGEVTYGPQPPAFSSDSRWLASFVRGSSLTIWSTASWKIEGTQAVSGTGRALAFAPEGARLAVASDREAAIWDVESGRKLVICSGPRFPETKEIAWSPDGRRVVTSADDGVLRFWNSSDGELLASIYIPVEGTDWLVVTPDGRLDGSDRALRNLVAWRMRDRVTVDGNLTHQHRVQGLWQSLVMPNAMTQ